MLRAWYNVIVKDPKVESLAKKRLAVCAECPHAKEKDVLSYAFGKEVKEHTMICSICNCPLIAKARGGKCPKKKWPV